MPILFRPLEFVLYRGLDLKPASGSTYLWNAYVHARVPWDGIQRFFEETNGAAFVLGWREDSAGRQFSGASGRVAFVRLNRILAQHARFGVGNVRAVLRAIAERISGAPERDPTGKPAVAIGRRHKV